MKVIGVASQKGGVGKTTAVVSLADIASDPEFARQILATDTAQGARDAEAARRDAPINVLLVDVDPQGSANFWCDRAAKVGKLHFDYTLSTDPRQLAQLRKEDYDVVIVDTPGSLEGGQVLSAVVEQCDFLIMPSTVALLALMPLVTTVRQLVLPRTPPVAYKVLLSQVDARREATELQARQLLSKRGLQVFGSRVRSYTAHADAPATGAVVTQYPGLWRSGSHALSDYIDVWDETSLVLGFATAEVN